MPTDKRDIQWLTYGAMRLRGETYGANKWDEAGTFKVFSEELTGHHFLTALQRVIGHATDPEAKTPGAIKRPFTPEPTNTPIRIPYDPRAVCHVCAQAEHPPTDHRFVSVEAKRAAAPAPMPRVLRESLQRKAEK